MCSCLKLSNCRDPNRDAASPAGGTSRLPSPGPDNSEHSSIHIQVWRLQYINPTCHMFASFCFRLHAFFFILQRLHQGPTKWHASSRNCQSAAFSGLHACSLPMMVGPRSVAQQSKEVKGNMLSRPWEKQWHFRTCSELLTSQFHRSNSCACQVVQVSQDDITSIH